jgi:hypothetical protein
MGMTRQWRTRAPATPFFYKVFSPSLTFQRSLPMSALVDSTPELDALRLLTVLRALGKGDFSVRLPEVWAGTAGTVAETLNEVIELNEHLAAELGRLITLVGERGRLGGLGGQHHSLIASLGQPASEAARVIGAVAKGDLRRYPARSFGRGRL